MFWSDNNCCNYRIVLTRLTLPTITVYVFGICITIIPRNTFTQLGSSGQWAYIRFVYLFSVKLFQWVVQPEADRARARECTVTPSFRAYIDGFISLQIAPHYIDPCDASRAPRARVNDTYRALGESLPPFRQVRFEWPVLISNNGRVEYTSG